MGERIKRFLRKHSLFAIAALLVGKILPGFFQYCRLIKKHGADVSILCTAWHGTGDYYICGMYLPAYIEQNQISNYVFLVNKRGSESKVMALFDGYKGHTEPIRSVEGLSRFSEFMQQANPLCKSFECSSQTSFIGEELKGYRGLSLTDFYLWYGFGFDCEPPKAEPHFSGDTQRIRLEIQRLGIQRGKTVLLSPFSTCSKAYLPPEELWKEIAVHLKECGYSVVTNCFGREIPVAGTISVSIPYKDIVPFLNEAGGFIGIRSGLCDILSQSSCKKIVIHPEKSDYWPTGSALSFVGMRAMGLNTSVVELVYDGNAELLLQRIINEIDYR